MPERRGPYRHRIAVRWGEVDQQGVVFNAHYLAYMDDAMETWLRPIRPLGEELGWDMMLRRCTIEWQGPLGPGDLLDIDVAVARWGRTSWELAFRGRCSERPVFTARVLYVSVAAGVNRPMETPAPVREFMGEPVDLLGPTEAEPPPAGSQAQTPPRSPEPTRRRAYMAQQLGPGGSPNIASNRSLSRPLTRWSLFMSTCRHSAPAPCPGRVRH